MKVAPETDVQREQQGRQLLNAPKVNRKLIIIGPPNDPKSEPKWYILRPRIRARTGTHAQCTHAHMCRTTQKHSAGKGLRCSRPLLLQTWTEKATGRQMLNPVVLRSADRTVKASDAQLRSFLGVRQRKREGERGADRASFDLLRLGQRKQEGVGCSTRLCLEAQTEQSRRQMLNSGLSLE